MMTMPILDELRPTERSLPSLAWLGSVREATYPLTRLRPIWVRETILRDETALPPSSVSHPEFHPYCALTICLEGKSTQYIGHECREVEAGSVVLLGPNTPHATAAAGYPVHAITIYILPILFLEMGPDCDGVRLLNRFTNAQGIAERVLQIPLALLRRLRRDMGSILEEFKHTRFGGELRMRSLLMESLVALFRWEESCTSEPGPRVARVNWSHIQKALHYMHDHHAEVIYVEQVARAIHVGERQLNGMFRELLGTSCIQYLNEYRVSIAAAMLSTSQDPITTVAFSVGFETLSHFNTMFRKVIGMSPTEYVGRGRKAG